MDFLSILWDYTVPFLVVLSVVVFVHELGHYVVARWNGVRVDVFSIGFGPEIFGRTDQYGTRWKVSAVPLGGYVKMFGESDFAEVDEDGAEPRPLTPAERAVSFHHKRVGQRAAIVAAGPLANFLFAVLALAVMFTVVGNPQPVAAVGSVQPGSAAAEAGFQPGDRILAIGGTEVRWFKDLRDSVASSPGVSLRFSVEREGRVITLVATPKLVTVGEGDRQESRGLLGVSPDPNQYVYVRVNPFTATGLAVERTFGLTAQIVAAVGQFFTGSRSTDELGGPLMIAKMSGDVAQGGWIHLVFFMAGLSINLGLLNLFPIPLLDGGHLVYYLAEAVRGRPLGVRAQEYGFRFGLILVLALMVYATWNDLVHLKVFQFLKNLIT